jgi:hypothetical protein
MKCFLHIGTEKTATTTIQNFFDANRKILLEQGYIYTKSAGITNHSDLAVAAYNSDTRDELTSQYGIYTSDEFEAFRLNTILSHKTKIHDIQNKNSTIIFSSEHFHSRLNSLDEIERLKTILYSIGVTRISVIVYLRRPADIANSMYSTAIKAGYVMDSPPLPGSPYWDNVCNHKNTIQKFSTVFGMQSIIPRIFDKHSLVNECILDDILSVIGIAKSSQLENPVNANESLSSLGVEVLRRLNFLIPSFIDDKPNPKRSGLVYYIEKNFSCGKYLMPKCLYEAYELKYFDSDKWVRDNFFPDKDALFDSGYPEYQKNHSISNDDLDCITRLIANIWNDYN